MAQRAGIGPWGREGATQAVKAAATSHQEDAT